MIYDFVICLNLKRFKFMFSMHFRVVQKKILFSNYIYFIFNDLNLIKLLYRCTPRIPIFFNSMYIRINGRQFDNIILKKQLNY